MPPRFGFVAISDLAERDEHFPFERPRACHRHVTRRAAEEFTGDVTRNNARSRRENRVGIIAHRFNEEFALNSVRLSDASDDRVVAGHTMSERLLRAEPPWT